MTVGANWGATVRKQLLTLKGLAETTARNEKPSRLDS
jgi:hypothetical protein